MQLNKSNFKAYLNCPRKAFKLSKKVPVTTSQKEPFFEFYNYQRIKELATIHFVSIYTVCDISSMKKYFNDKISQTTIQINNQTQFIKDAAFKNGPLQGQIDFLKRNHDGTYDIYLLKATLSVDEKIGVDGAFCRMLVQGQITINQIHVIYLDQTFKKDGVIRDVRALLKIEYMIGFDSILDLSSKYILTPNQLQIIQDTNSEPNATPNKGCSYCEYNNQCISNIDSKDCSLSIHGLKDTALHYFYNGYTTIDQLPYDTSFTPRQNIQIFCKKNHCDIIDLPLLKNDLLKLQGPYYYFLDFESLNTLVPRIEKTSPLQQVCFQYSLHITDQNLNIIDHKEFLSFQSDCTEEFLTTLLKDLQDTGSIIVWNLDFERSRLQELATMYPKYRLQVEKLEDRYYDLMIPFKNNYFYKQDMQGSYSLKYVYPSLVKDKETYQDLSIQNGLQTMISYFKCLKGELDPNTLKQAFLEYCCLDTLSMIYILDVVQQTVNQPPNTPYYSLQDAYNIIDSTINATNNKN